MPGLEGDYFLAFHYCKGIGPHRFLLLLETFGTAQKAWLSSSKQWLEAGFPKTLVEAVSTFKETFSFEKTKDILSRLNIRYLPQNSNEFPYLLTQIPSCPIGLFIKGKLIASDGKALAVVGTRKITPYGREVTEKFVQRLSYLGFTIISGLARGVDGTAHRVALAAGGRTIAILGNGLDKIYPPEHKHLAEEVITHGAVISEYPPYSPINPGNFPARNRLISGMSLGVLVTEASQISGTKLTALAALEQNREVFAVPGPITSAMSSGPGELIQMGAKLVMNEQDILDELQVSLDQNKPNQTLAESKRETVVTFTDKTQKEIWQFLGNGVQHIDEIVRSTNLPIATVTTSLTIMELHGLVKHIGSGNYIAV